MATTRQAHTVWEGDLIKGKGVVTFDSSGIAEQPVSWASRAEQANGKTSPEELIAAAHSSCFSMALSNGLSKAGTPPTKLTTQADVTLRPGHRHHRHPHHGAGRGPGSGRSRLRQGRGGRQGELPRQPGALGHEHHPQRLARLTSRHPDRH